MSLCWALLTRRCGISDDRDTNADQLEELSHSTDENTYFRNLKELPKQYKQFNDPDMSPNQLDELLKHISTIKIKDMASLTNLIPWMEELAVTIVLGCPPEPVLKLCTALGGSLLTNGTPSQVRGLEAEVHPTLWWIFLNTTMHCSNGMWPSVPSAELEPQAYNRVMATSDSTLTLCHFRDSRKRQENSLWLMIVGVTGILYAFSLYPEHEDGPKSDAGDAYFGAFISILRSALHSPAITSSDPFVGELPVYSGAEVRLYEFDSLHYGIDAIRCALSSGVYEHSTFQNDLAALLHDLTSLRDIKQLIIPRPDQHLDLERIQESYEELNCLLRPWLVPGMLRYVSNVWLDPRPWWEQYGPDFLRALILNPDYLDERAGNRSRATSKLLSRLLPDIIFDGVHPSNPADQRESAVKATNWDYAQASGKIAALAWMPFEDTLSEFQEALEARLKYSAADRNPIWKLLHSAGLLQTPLPDHLRWRQGWSSGSIWYLYVYIKASLIEKLHSLPKTGSLSLNILEWLIALSPHCARLLRWGEWEELDSDEQAFIITSLMQLLNTLLDACVHISPPETPPSNTTRTSTQTAPNEAASAHTELEALVNADILLTLSRPFAETSPREGIRVDPAWYNNLAKVIERLSREFTSLASSDKYKPVYADLVTYYEHRTHASDDDASMFEFFRSLRGDVPQDSAV